MTRSPREVLPYIPLHVVQRGNNRTHILQSGADFARMSLMLKESSRNHECDLHAYVLMGNHLHLLMTPYHKDGPARMMQSLGIRYTRYFNKQNRRTGTLWDGRFYSSVIKDARYFLSCSRYIELNPVRAGMVAHPSEYQWSSFRRNALGLADALVTSHSIFNTMGSDESQRCARYHALFEHSIDPSVCDEIRKSARSGIAVGTPTRAYLRKAGRLHL